MSSGRHHATSPVAATKRGGGGSSQKCLRYPKIWVPALINTGGNKFKPPPSLLRQHVMCLPVLILAPPPFLFAATHDDCAGQRTGRRGNQMITSKSVLCGNKEGGGGAQNQHWRQVQKFGGPVREASPLSSDDNV